MIYLCLSLAGCFTGKLASTVQTDVSQIKKRQGSHCEGWLAVASWLGWRYDDHVVFRLSARGITPSLSQKNITRSQHETPLCVVDYRVLS